jgi:hypothetical protein
VKGARLLLVLVPLLAACTPKPPPAPTSQPEAQRSYPPMDLGGQKVLILPLQASEGLPGNRDETTQALVTALGARDGRTQWVPPGRLRAALRTAPGYAQDPGALPMDPYRHHGENYIMEPLAGLVRRYSALTDTRLVMIPRAARWVAWGDRPGGRVRLATAVVDSRSGGVVWLGEADGEPYDEATPEAVRSAAEAMARRLVVPGQP